MATLMAPSAASTPVPGALLPVYKRAPIELVRGDGIRLFDAGGREYVDFTSGIAVNALGYGDEGLRQAMHEAADGLVHVSNLFRTAPGELLAQRLVDLSFADRVFFCNSGVEANEGAFKFARRWARAVGTLAKHEILGVRGAFHGRLFATLAATDRPSYRAPFRPLAGGVSIAERDLESLGLLLEPETVAALVIEPIQGEGGVRVLDAGYLRELRALTRERRIALIFDEIQCGLGRTGHLFAYQRVNVEPDMMTLAKPIAGGLPMGAILITEEIAATIQPGDHGTTFGGGPFVASVAHHVLERVSDAALLESVRTNGQWLGAALREMANNTARIRDVRGVGFIWGIDVHEPAGDVIARARDEGLLLVSAGDYTLRILPPLVATRGDLEEGLHRLQRALG
ncbi:MAG TPA: acetylornithine transaminase [Gemmatimonadaceae bacterium]|nr:acetylornithine transaminase [Gemmatimonadaceae bacterium]